MTTRTFLTLSLLAGVVAPAAANVQDRLYEFTDAYYRQNGVDPNLIGGRRQADGVLAVKDTPIFSYQRDVRALFTVGGWTEGGKPIYFTIFGELSGNSFLANSAGRKAMEIADRSPEYIFPQRGTDPFGLRAPRQPFMLDTRNGYFSNNPLGLWIHVWVNWTDRAFNTADGVKMLNDLARRNGLGLDGTPIIRTVSELDGLYSKGYVTKSTLPFGTAGRYAVCPAVKDPTNGGIAMDQFLFTVTRPDGTPLVESIFLNFESLRRTGRWAG